jgi:hypothetical protein
MSVCYVLVIGIITEGAESPAHLNVFEDHGCVRIVLDHIIGTTNGTCQAGTAAERTVLQRCGPVRATPDGRPPEIPSYFNATTQ